MWTRIETLVRCTVLSIFHMVPQKLQCFELYGFDILFDEKLQPWLIEANFSPALAVESDVDIRVKHGLIHDLVATLNIQQPRASAEPSSPTSPSPSGCDTTKGKKAPTVIPPSDNPKTTPAPKGSTPLPTSSRLAPTGSSSSATSRAAGSGGSAGAARRAQSSTRAPASSSSTTELPRTTSTTSRAAVTSAGNGASAVRAARTQRSNSVAGPLATTTRDVGASSASSSAVQTTGFVDKAAGRMKMIFPFNAETEKLSIEALAPGKLESSLKGMLAEVRKADSKASQQLKSLASVYAERSAAEGRRK
jgi:tubulin polyglutamylase TTLL2